MSQITTKFIAANAVTAAKLGSATATSVQALFADGSGNAAYRSILSTDLPSTITSNTSGTASNITATSNATLTTLSALTTASALAAVGTITSGTWNGTAIGPTFGGTGQTSYTTGDTLYASATNVLSKLGIGTSGQVLTVSAGIPSWQTATVGANTTLSNLTSPTAINQDLQPGTTGTLNLGDIGKGWLGAYINTIFPGTYTGTGNNQTQIQLTTQQLLDKRGVASVRWSNRQLRDGNISYDFTVTAANATAGATYTDTAGTIWTVMSTIVSGSDLLAYEADSSAPPLSSDTLTKTSGTGDATIAFSASTLNTTGIQSLNWGIRQTIDLLANASIDWNARQLLFTDGTTPMLDWSAGGFLNASGNVISGVASGTASGQALQWGQIGVVNGIAGLDSGGHIPLSQLPSTLVEYKGTWNASTNTPTLSNASGPNNISGYFFITSVAGTVDFGSGPIAFNAGDWVLFNGTIWERAVQSNVVQSVNGQTGIVTVNAINQLTGDVTAGPASGSASAASSLVATSNATLTTLSALTTASSLSTVGTITSGTWNGTTIAIAHGGTGQTTAAAAFNALAPLTTTGDLIYEAAPSTAARIPIGTSGQVLTVAGGIPSWVTPAASSTDGKDTFVLSGTDISNQFVTLSHTPIANSTDLLVQGGGVQLEGASYDYTVSGATIVFQNGLATGGASALVSGDVLQVAYQY